MQMHTGKTLPAAYRSPPRINPGTHSGGPFGVIPLDDDTSLTFDTAAEALRGAIRHAELAMMMDPGLPLEDVHKAITPRPPLVSVPPQAGA